MYAGSRCLIDGRDDSDGGAALQPNRWSLSDALLSRKRLPFPVDGKAYDPDPKELPDAADAVARAERVRQLRLLVRAHPEERIRFEVENPDAARIIRVAASSDDSAHNAA